MAPGPTPPGRELPSRVLPVVDASGSGGLRPQVGIARSTDRRIAFGGLILAATWIGAAAAALLLPPASRLGSWLPLHMVLAGGATTAIAAILPFFSAALVAAPPARPMIRIAGIALVSGGALVVMIVFSQACDDAFLAALGGGSFLAGLGLVAGAAFGPLKGSLGQRRRLVERAYAVALVNVAVGVTLAVLLIGGNGTVGAAWGSLKPAHAWLNLVGFVGLVIVATLLHLAPTVLGTRIRPLLAGRVAVVGIGIGAPLVAAGLALRVDPIGRAGALVAMTGAIGVAWHGIAVRRDGQRGRWTTDNGWHLFTGGSILAGHLWLGLGVAVAAGRVLAIGAGPESWSVTVLAGPFLIGGVLQILLGAITHLLPAVGPGDPTRHAAQRRLLGRLALARLVTANAGAAIVTLGFGPAAWIGGERGGGDVVAIGLAATVVGITLSLALLGTAARAAPRLALSPRG